MNKNKQIIIGISAISVIVALAVGLWVWNSKTDIPTTTPIMPQNTQAVDNQRVSKPEDQTEAETKADEPKANKPKADENKVDEPKAENKVDEPKADETKANENNSDNNNENTQNTQN
ncbi:hypothetical protein [Candidatus Phytoplasma meliae]|uniref:Uncharacterized protein n=1 Tax=Candidatus Phytoplasma meliae TaxID=1848402 RepID=A0ABS5CXX5_9MOLU|nr:hypothetical protein [Candidatus Phytoplasma meliae]MBP5835828.1 hypothetical protein [Candidatus Phytoplasma meliae]